MVIFDLCGTLYKSNTTFDLIRFIRPMYSKILFSIPVRVLSKVTRAFFGFDLVRFLVVKGFQGYSRDELVGFSEKFFDDYLVGLEFPEIMKLLSCYGNDVVIMTASIDPIAEVVSKRLGVKYLSSELAYVNGLCVGSLSVDLLGKKASYIPSGVALVVTDNRSDLELVLLADRAVIVSGQKNLSFWEDKLRPQDRVIEV